MASDVIVGSVGTVNGYATEVHRNAAGTVTVYSAREAVYSASQLARLRELLDRAAMPGQAEASMPEPAVMKILRRCFFAGSPDATGDDWRRYCELIGPGVAEAYAAARQEAIRDAG